MNRSLIDGLLGERDRKSCNYAAVDRFTDRRTFERNSKSCLVLSYAGVDSFFDQWATE